MDPITTAILAALDVAAAAGADTDPDPARAGDQAAAEAYQALKLALSRTFGRDSEVFGALGRLEQKPGSSGRREVLQEEVAAAKAHQDLVLLAAAQRLLDQIETQAGSSTTVISPPLQRPPRPEHFTGRETELAQLLASLQPGRIVNLHGPAGIGKGALAVEALWQLAPGQDLPDVFPDGIIDHSFYNQPRVDIALEQIARLFGQESIPTAYEAAERALAERRILIVLHEAELADDLPGLLAIRGQSGLLVLSDTALETADVRQEVPPLLPDQALPLLQAWARTRVGDEQAGRRIGEQVGGLPLALRLAGQAMVARRESDVGFVTWLETTPLPGLDEAQRQSQSVPLLLEYTTAQLSEMAQRAMAVIGLLAPIPFDPTIVIGALTLETGQGLLAAIRKIFQKSTEPDPDFGQALAELERGGLIQQAGQRYEVSHPLVHAYAQTQLTPPKRAIHRLVATFVAMVWEETVLGAEGYARLDRDRPHFMRVLDKCLQWEDWEAAYGLAAALEDYLDRQGFWAERVIANEIGLITAWQLGRPSEGAWLSNIGDTYRTMGHARLAIRHFEKALATARETGDKHSQGNSLGNLGLAYRDLGQIERARHYLTHALTLFEETGSPSANYVRGWLKELEEAM